MNGSTIVLMVMSFLAGTIIGKEPVIAIVSVFGQILIELSAYISTV